MQKGICTEYLCTWRAACIPYGVPGLCSVVNFQSRVQERLAASERATQNQKDELMVAKPRVCEVRTLVRRYVLRTLGASGGLTRAAVSWITGPAALMSPVLSPNAYAISGRTNQLGTNDGAKLSRATPGRSSLQLHTTTTTSSSRSPCIELLSSKMFWI